MPGRIDTLTYDGNVTRHNRNVERSDRSNGRPFRRRLWFGLGTGVLAALLAAGGSRSSPQDKAAKPVAVVMTTPITDEVTDYQDVTGRLDSLKTVDIRARVSGYVLEAPFKEGDIVREGDLLFQIDPRTYQADYNQAVANLQQAEADRKLREKNVERARRLIGTNAISQEDYDQSVGDWEKSVAAEWPLNRGIAE